MSKNMIMTLVAVAFMGGANLVELSAECSGGNASATCGNFESCKSSAETA